MSWIVIPRWDEFQHPDAARSRVLPWLKDWTRQLSQDEYLALTFHQRGILHDLRMEYARALRQLSDSTVTLSRRLGHRVMTRDLEALSDAGLLQFVASKPASRPALLDGKGSKEQDQTSNHASISCPHCGLDHTARGNRLTAIALADHLVNVHNG